MGKLIRAKNEGHERMQTMNVVQSNKQKKYNIKTDRK